MTAAWHPCFALPWADRGDTVSVICLHGVHTKEMEEVAPPPTSSISVESFEANLRGLRARYTVISLDQAVGMLSGRVPWRPHCAALTFDDSLKCTVDIALPVLERLGLPATVFVSTEAIETGVPYWWLRLDHAWHRARNARAVVDLPMRERVMVERGNLNGLRQLKSVLRRTLASQRDAAVAEVERQFDVKLEEASSQYPYAAIMKWPDVRNFVQCGFSVGSHTVTHPNLTLLEAEKVRAELCISRRIIEEQTNSVCRHLCYPYGAFDTTVAALAEECGYEATTTLSPGRNGAGENLHALRRYAMPAASWRLGYVLSGAAYAVECAGNAIRSRHGDSRIVASPS